MDDVLAGLVALPLLVWADVPPIAGTAGSLAVERP